MKKLLFLLLLLPVIGFGQVVQNGDLFQVQVPVINNGAGTDNNVQVSFNLPTGVAYNDHEVSKGYFIVDSVRWYARSMKPQQVEKIILTLEVTDLNMFPAIIEADISGSSIDTIQGNNTFRDTIYKISDVIEATAMDFDYSCMCGSVAVNDTLCNYCDTEFSLIPGSGVNGNVVWFDSLTGNYRFQFDNPNVDASFQYDIICKGCGDGTEYAEGSATQTIPALFTRFMVSNTSDSIDYYLRTSYADGGNRCLVVADRVAGVDVDTICFANSGGTFVDSNFIDSLGFSTKVALADSMDKASQDLSYTTSGDLEFSLTNGNVTSPRIEFGEGLQYNYEAALIFPGISDYWSEIRLDTDGFVAGTGININNLGLEGDVILEFINTAPFPGFTDLETDYGVSLDTFVTEPQLVDSLNVIRGEIGVNVDSNYVDNLGFSTKVALADSIDLVRSEIPYTDTSATNELQDLQVSYTTMVSPFSFNDGASQINLTNSPDSFILAAGNGIAIDDLSPRIHRIQSTLDTTALQSQVTIVGDTTAVHSTGLGDTEIPLDLGKITAINLSQSTTGSDPTKKTLRYRFFQKLDPGSYIQLGPFDVYESIKPDSLFTASDSLFYRGHAVDNDDYFSVGMALSQFPFITLAQLSDSLTGLQEQISGLQNQIDSIPDRMYVVGGTIYDKSTALDTGALSYEKGFQVTRSGHIEDFSYSFGNIDGLDAGSIRVNLAVVQFGTGQDEVTSTLDYVAYGMGVDHRKRLRLPTNYEVTAGDIIKFILTDSDGTTLTTSATTGFTAGATIVEDTTINQNSATATVIE